MNLGAEFFSSATLLQNSVVVYYLSTCVQEAICCSKLLYVNKMYGMETSYFLLTSIKYSVKKSF